MQQQHRWDARYAELLAFVADHGHANVPRSFRTSSGAGLGAWLHRQRALAAANSLPSERQERLQAAGVRWSLRSRDAGLEAFAAFYRSHGHGLVPHTFHTEDGFPLGTWVQSRRRQWAQDPQRTAASWPELTTLDFIWEVRNADAAWGAGLAALEQYRRNYGDVLVPHWFTTADGLLLGRWVDSRRVEYRRGALGPERVQQLEQLGMVWRLRRPAHDPARRQREDTHFDSMLLRVTHWSRQHNGLLPAARTRDGDGVAIGRWLLRQRRLHSDHRLTPDRVEALRTIDPRVI